MLLMQDYMWYVYGTRTFVSELLFKLKEAIFDLLLNVERQFSLRAQELAFTILLFLKGIDWLVNHWN